MSLQPETAIPAIPDQLAHTVYRGLFRGHHIDSVASRHGLTRAAVLGIGRRRGLIPDPGMQQMIPVPPPPPRTDPAEEISELLTRTFREIMSPERDWMSQALCAQTDPELFFPERGGSVRTAKRVCAACPVREQCLALALEKREMHGVWGGAGERPRRKMLRQAV